uniref:hypothetical protein n=1 Tax=Mycolicibacterium obuense TaxID=1807 RepID=UPI003F58A1E3
MTATVDSPELRAPAYLHQSTAAVREWLMDDGDRVHRFDVLAEMSDGRGTEIDLIATTDGYLKQAPPEVTDAQPGLAGWITSSPGASSPEQAGQGRDQATAAAGSVSYLVLNAILGPGSGGGEPNWEQLRIGGLVAAAANAVHDVTGPAVCPDRVDVVVHGSPTGQQGVTIEDARRLSALGIARALTDGVGWSADAVATDHRVRLDLHLLPVAAALYIPPHPDAWACLTVAPPTDAVVAAQDDLGNPAVAIRASAQVVIAFRPSTTTTTQATAFGAAITRHLGRPSPEPRPTRKPHP